MKTSDPTNLPAPAPIIAASSCLLGHAVRYDGTDKRDDYLVRTLGRLVTLQAICPELVIGMGVPRAPIQVVVKQREQLALGVDDPSRNVSASLRAYAASLAEQADRLCGFVFKARSPSCGLGSVPLHDEQGQAIGVGNGLFSDTLTRLHPLLPCIDEQGLTQPEPRDRFLRQVFARHAWQHRLTSHASQTRLEQFHAHYKYTLMAYSPRHYRELGQLVASRLPLATKHHRYTSGLHQALSQPNQTGRQLNALQHLFGYVSKQLTKQQIAAFKASLDACQASQCDWRQPWWQLRALCQVVAHPYVRQSHYLFPNDAELALRFAADQPAAG